MDPVREALTLVASEVDRSRLGPPADIRARGDRIRRRRRALAVQGAVAAAVVLLVASVVGGGVLRATPPPVQQPTPTPTQAADVGVVRQGCGHGLACPDGSGHLRAVLDAQRGGDQLSADFDLPSGWSVEEGSGNGFRLVDPTRRTGVAVLWPVGLPAGSTVAPTAEAMAGALAHVPGSTTQTPQQVTIDGRTGWRVLFAGPVAGPAQCLDPRTGLYEGENYARVGPDDMAGCRRLLDLGVPTVGQTPVAVGLSVSGGTEITLLDGLGIPAPGAPDVVALWRWGGGLTAPAPSRVVLESLRLGRFADPHCGTVYDHTLPLCAETDGRYVVHGDPVDSDTGIHRWLARAAVPVPAGWTVLADDGRGDVVLTDATGAMGAQLLWGPRLPGHPPTALDDARAWADATAGSSSVVATRPVEGQVGGRAAWRLDLSARSGAVAFRPSDPAYEDDRCGPNPAPYAVAVACRSAAASFGAATSTDGGVFFEGNMSARVWFVQVDPGRVLLVMVWGKQLHSGQPPALPPVLAATAAMTGSTTITTG